MNNIAQINDISHANHHALSKGQAFTVIDLRLEAFEHFPLPTKLMDRYISEIRT